MSRRLSAAVFGIVVLAAALRLWTIGSGIPYDLGTDEPAIMTKVVQQMMKSGDLNPHFYDYPGLTFYLHMAVACLRFLTGAMAGRWSSLEQVWEGDFYLWGRIATAGLSVVTVYLVYRIALRWGQLVAVIAALAMAVQPQLIHDSQFALTDTPLAFFVVLTLLLSLIATGELRARWFLAAGLAAGLATATKYSGAFALLMPLAGALAMDQPMRGRVGAATASVAGAAAGFIAGSPYSLLDLPNFLNGFASLMQHYNQSRPALEAADIYFKFIRNWFGWPGFLDPYLTYYFPWLALLMVFVGLTTVMFQVVPRGERPAALTVLVFPIAYLWFISNQSLQYGRYAAPLAPMLSIFLALGMVRVRELIVGPHATVRAQRVALAVLLVVLVPPFAQAAGFDWHRRFVSTKTQAAQWILENVRPDEPLEIEAEAVRLPPRFHADNTNRLIRESVDGYRREGTVYLIGSSTESDRYNSRSREYAEYQTLLKTTQVVMIFPQSADHPGPTITIMRIPH
jgi:4-amino-4-deoxy-L-arabinose transferase-like glycosyltransferase